MHERIIYSIRKNFPPLEAVVWLAGLVVMALLPPGEQSHFSLCPLKNLGFGFCPGCGLGHSISYLFHGHLVLSLSAHPLGIFAVIVLSFRILQLTKHYYSKLWQE